MDDAWAKYFANRLAIHFFFTWGICVSLKEVICWRVNVFIWYFLNSFKLLLDWYWSWFLRWRFSKRNFWFLWWYVKFWLFVVYIWLDFLMRGLFWIPWGLFDVLLYPCTLQWTIVCCVLGIVLLAMVTRVLVKCIIDSYRFVFVSRISVVKHSFLKDCQFAFLKFNCRGFRIVCDFKFSIIMFSIIIG